MLRSIITALVALVIGAAGMYFYQQGAVAELRNAAAALQTQVTESKAAADAAAAEVAKLQEAGKALEERAKMADMLQAKVTELEAALAAAKAAVGTAQ
jgi:cell division protein FtsL